MMEQLTGPECILELDIVAEKSGEELEGKGVTNDSEEQRSNEN